jgi:hypothetical protein
VKLHRPNPYCGFKDDKERRNALISRDVRLVLIAVIAVYGPRMLQRIMSFF